MQGLTPASAREFLASNFWKEWREMTSALTYEKWLAASTPKAQVQLRLQIEHISVAEEALIRFSCQDQNPNAVNEEQKEVELSA